MSVTKSETKLDYPLHACTWDSLSRLVCGGGAGGRTGMNKLTVLNTKATDPQLQRVSEVVLRRDEDNVTSLATGGLSKGSAIAYAGINSSPEDLKKGVNQHLKVFTLDPVSERKAAAAIPPRIAEVGRYALFTQDDGGLYQRLLRLSQPFEGRMQLGAVGTGLAKAPQIVLFDVASVSTAAPRVRGKLDLEREANDLDIIHTGGDDKNDSFQLIYCDNHQVYTMKVSNKEKEVSEPQLVWTTAVGDDGTRPTFQSIRWLTPTFAIAVSNLPKRAGALVTGFRISGNKAGIATRTQLPRSISMATGLSVACLSPVASPGAKQLDAQFVLAISGMPDNSISLYQLELQVVGGIDLLTHVYPFKVIKAAHESLITSLALSRFQPPAKTTSRTQYLHLASVSVDESVVVHHIPLKKVFDKTAALKRGGPPRQPRYVVAPKAQIPGPQNFFIATAVILVILAVFMQGFLEIKGHAAPVIGAHRFTPSRWHAAPAGGVAGVEEEPGSLPPPSTMPKGLAEMIAEDILGGGEDDQDQKKKEKKKVVLHGGPAEGVQVAAHDEEVHGPAASWDELSLEQQIAWKERLKEAGHWGEHMGEAIFKGILFSQLAGAVGAMVGG